MSEGNLPDDGVIRQGEVDGFHRVINVFALLQESELLAECDLTYRVECVILAIQIFHLVFSMCSSSARIWRTHSQTPRSPGLPKPATSRSLCMKYLEQESMPGSSSRRLVMLNALAIFLFSSLWAISSIMENEFICGFLFQ